MPTSAFGDVTLKMLAAALVLLLVACGKQSGAVRDPASSSARADTVFAEGFEDGTLGAWSDGVDPKRQRVVQDPSIAQSGSHYLEVTYPAGGDGGWLTHFFMPGYDSLYVSYYVRLPANWKGGTKLIALYGSRIDDRWSALGKAGICPNGTDFFTAMVVTEASGNPGPVRFYTYYPAMAREPDGRTCWGRYGDGSEVYVPPLILSPDVWHHVELWVRLNAPGRSDAMETLWLDGVQRATWSGFSFRTSDALRLNAVQLSFNRGISGGPTTEKLLVDNLVVTTRQPAR